MDEKTFAELIESIAQMGAYLRGEIPPERLRTVVSDGITRITILGPDETESPAGDSPK